LSCALVARLGVALALVPLSAGALETVTVSARGSADVSGEPEAVRASAFEEAAVDAVAQVARRFLPDDRVAEAEAALRAGVRGRATRFLLTYRVDEQRRVPAPGDPSRERLEIALTATVDAGQVKEEVERAGWLGRPAQGGPSVALRVRAGEGAERVRPARLEALVRDLSLALERAGFAMVDPTLRAETDPRSQSALELARALGADVAIDVLVGFRDREPRGEVAGGVASAQVRAQRATDGFELALARFEAPAYHQDPDEARLRGLEALEPQIVNSVQAQLSRNWAAVEPAGGAIVVSLIEVTSLLQVESVKSSLVSVLGADSAELVALGPRRAALRVETDLSAGALRERLAALYFEGFRLEPLESAEGRVELRLEARTEPAEPAAP
jgi:hypothetical protein